MRGQNQKVAKHDRNLKSELVRLRKKLNKMSEEVRELRSVLSELDGEVDEFEEEKLCDVEEEQKPSLSEIMSKFRPSK